MLLEAPYRQLLIMVSAGLVVAGLGWLGHRAPERRHGWRQLEPSAMHWTGLVLGVGLVLLFLYVRLFVGSSRPDAEHQMNTDRPHRRFWHWRSTLRLGCRPGAQARVRMARDVSCVAQRQATDRPQRRRSHRCSKDALALCPLVRGRFGSESRQICARHWGSFSNGSPASGAICCRPVKDCRSNSGAGFAARAEAARNSRHPFSNLRGPLPH